MIRYIYGDELHQYPLLRRTMFRDRAMQFRDRLNWAVTLNAEGEEHDEYDRMNPLYVIWEGSDGSHRGSMRFLPTTGPNMIADHFSHLAHGVSIRSPLIWECTRFCLAPDAERRISSALMLAGHELMRGFHLDHLVGIFDDRMIRLYRLQGSSPTVVSAAGEGASRISLGLWEFSDAAYDRLARRSGLSPELSGRWFRDAFEVSAPEYEIAA